MKKALIQNTLLIGIFVIALFLRIWGINFGLPQVQIGDEGALVAAALYSGANLLKPFRPMYGQLIPYLLLIEYGIYFVTGVLTGVFKTPLDVLVSFIKNPRDLLLIGRITMMGFGITTIWLTYFIGKRFYNRRIGLLAAFFLAVTFLHVKESHYLKEGNLAALFALGCYYFVLKILQRGKKRDYLGAGITLGLGLGAKYEPILLLPIILLSQLLSHKNNIFYNLKYFLTGFIPGIIITFPYLFLNPFEYLQKFIAEYKLTTTIYPLYLQGKPIWWWFLNVHLPQGLGTGLFVIANIGFVVSLFRSKYNRSYLFIPLLPVIFLTTIDYWQKFHNARYALLVLPYYTLAAAVCIDWILHSINKKLKAPILLTLTIMILLWPSLLRDIKFNTVILKPDTRLQSKDWIENNIPAGSRVLVESMVRPEYPANINTPLILNGESIDRYIQEAIGSGYPGTYLHALKLATTGRVGYDLVVTPRVDIASDIYTGSQTSLTTADYWVRNKVNYLILSSWHVKPNTNINFQKTINDSYELIQEFYPNPEFPEDPHFVQLDYSVLDTIDVFRKDLIFGPKIQIYRIKQKTI